MEPKAKYEMVCRRDTCLIYFARPQGVEATIADRGIPNKKAVSIEKGRATLSHGGGQKQQDVETKKPVNIPATLVDLNVARDPPPVILPEGALTLFGEPREPERRRFGSFSHPGPVEIAVDKKNQDFAFHVELKGPADTAWVLCGVADGVGQATWSSRASRHAAAAFVEAVNEAFSDPGFPRDEVDLAGDKWPALIARLLHARLFSRIRDDVKRLLDGRYVDETWKPELFAQMFWDASDAEDRIRTKWFQTTLLAVALGPYGGFGVFLGDGFVRVDRRLADGRWSSSPGLDPTLQISMELTEERVRACVERLPARGAMQISVLMTTDGVSNSTREGLERALVDCKAIPGYENHAPLERVLFENSAECERALERLAALPADLADRDNMSMAFALRHLETAVRP